MEDHDIAKLTHVDIKIKASISVDSRREEIQKSSGEISGKTASAAQKDMTERDYDDDE